MGSIDMGETMHQEAAALEELLAQEFELELLDRLAHFADRYAGDRQLFYRALLLRREASTSGDRGSQRAQAQEILELVSRSYQENPTAALDERRRKIERARKQTRDIELPSTPILRARGVGKSYGDHFQLRGVDLDLRPGQITGIVGRNAHGKTTLLRILAGALKHDEGQLDFEALNEFQETGIDWALVKNRIAYLPQDLPVWRGSLRNNIHFEASIHGIRGETNEREVEYILERLELGAELGKGWKELSGGTKLRFALARALVHKPVLLVLDEPLANLDFKAQQTLLTDLRNLAGSLRYPLSVVISSQHLHEVEAVSDRIVFLREGRVIFNGPRGEIGRRRATNTFELDVDCEEARLQSVLSKIGIRSIRHSGVSFIVRTPRYLEGSDVLRQLMDSGITVEYFRDISRSTKALFEVEEGGETLEEPDP